tara:strand:- start:2734 stop:3003 length:270 start_codon:yes stop_codon:yes gene_type:complete
MLQKILGYVILTNTFLFFLLYSNLNLNINNIKLEENIYSIFKKEEIETVKLVNIKNSFYYKIILTDVLDLVKLNREIDSLESINNDTEY